MQKKESFQYRWGLLWSISLICPSALKNSSFISYLPIFGNHKSGALKGLLRYVQVFFLIVVMLFAGCKSSNGLVTKKHKKLKKGEPIPCPMKDC